MLHIQIEKLPPALRDELDHIRSGGTLLLWEGVLPVAALVVFPTAPTFDRQLVEALDKALADPKPKRRGKRR